MKKIITVLLMCGLVASCAGRKADPVAFSQSGDLSKTCEQLHSEVELNSAQVRRLLDQKKSTTQKNVVAGVVGAVIFLPALFFMDLKGADKEELTALVNRNKNLASIADKKGCPISATQVEQKAS